MFGFISPVSDLLGSALGCERLSDCQVSVPWDTQWRLIYEKITKFRNTGHRRVEPGSRAAFCWRNKELGDIIVAQSPREVAEKSVSRTWIRKEGLAQYTVQDVIIIMLPAGRHVWEVCTNERMDFSVLARRQIQGISSSTVALSVSPPPSSEPILSCNRVGPTEP